MTATDTPTKVFISYRRTGDLGAIGRLTDRLSLLYGDENVFRDISKLRSGENFEERIGKAIGEATVVIAVIGKDWAGSRILRKPRIADEADWVRKELEHALLNETPVIPVLIGDASLPTEADLPASLSGLLSVHTGRLRDESWEGDSTDLVDAIAAAADGARDGDNLAPFVWQKAEVNETKRSRFLLPAVAAVALAAGALMIYLGLDPNSDAVNLDDPATWVPPARSDSRSTVAHLSLQLALLELQASTQESSGDNDGFNVAKFTERFNLQNVPWSAAFVTWCYLQALVRTRNDGKAQLPFVDSPATARVAASLRKQGWLIEPFDADRAQPGDIAFFERRGRISHSEIIYAVTADSICSVGGNVSNKVSGKCRPLNHERLVGLGAIPAKAFE